ncbi:AraC family transcriptional regulator [Oceaniserpentilla sp. 4NH20-0058]|uniref:AraC family transcriptional regulator n=1 Tax=Oceaniserpentilla sp. 4NH20-0058 TaxID=3127660 RepID=UPI0031053A19
MKTSTIASHYVRAALAGASAQGRDIEFLLQKAGIGKEVLHAPKARVYPDKMANLLRTLVNELQDEFLGLGHKPSPPGSFETLLQLIVPCSTLQEALQMGTRLYRLFDQAIHINFEPTPMGGVLAVNQHYPCLNKNQYLTELQLVLWHRICCWLTGKRIPIRCSEFAYDRPSHADEYPFFFYGENRFNQARTQIHIDQQHLDLPIIRHRSDLPELMEEAPYVFLVKPNNTASINAQIRRILEKHQGKDLPDLENVATQLNMSATTLRRRLKTENTSFQAIKDQVRRDLAICYLSDHTFSINEIALKVGFTEPSTFHRAFKKWTGITPGDYRSSEA